MFSHIFWNWLFRSLLFWILVLATIWLLATIKGFANLAPLAPGVQLMWRGDFSAISTPDFAYALAAFLGTSALGFAVAFGLMHALVIVLTVNLLKESLSKAAIPADFSRVYESFHQKFKAHPLIGRLGDL